MQRPEERFCADGFRLGRRYRAEKNVWVEVQVPHLDLPMPLHDDENLVLALMPVLPLGDPGLADIHRKLTVIDGFKQLGERSPVVAVHFEVERDFFFR